MAKKVSKAQAERIMQVAAAAAHCLRRLRLTGKRLTGKRKAKLKACMVGLVGKRK